MIIIKTRKELKQFLDEYDGHRSVNVFKNKRELISALWTSYSRSITGDKITEGIVAVENSINNAKSASKRLTQNLSLLRQRLR